MRTSRGVIIAFRLAPVLLMGVVGFLVLTDSLVLLNAQLSFLTDFVIGLEEALL